MKATKSKTYMNTGWPLPVCADDERPRAHLRAGEAPFDTRLRRYSG